MRHLLTIVGIVVTLATACQPNHTDPRRSMANDIFRKNIRLLTLYTDSIGQATDSAAVYQMMEDYDKRLTAIYFNHLPDTDLEITEAENDTLVIMTRRLLQLRDKRLYGFAHPSDSTYANLPVDSLQNIAAK